MFQGSFILNDETERALKPFDMESKRKSGRKIIESSANISRVR